MPSRIGLTTFSLSSAGVSSVAFHTVMPSSTAAGVLGMQRTTVTDRQTDRKTDKQTVSGCDVRLMVLLALLVLVVLA